MIERVVTFGPGRALVGVLAEPGDRAAAVRPAVIMLNAGLIHRVGPNRLHVRLARQLAVRGVLSLRIDLSGRGDSEVRRDALPFGESGIVETQDAMQFLADAVGCRRFVLLGICSGASTAGDAAYLDDRVAGAVVIEGPTFPTPRFRARYYRKRLFRLETWWNTLAGTNALGRRLRRAVGMPLPAAPEVEMIVEGDAPPPTTDVLGAALGQMIDRGVELLAVFSGSTKAYNYAGQLQEAFPAVNFAGRLQEAYYPDADHTFTRCRDQHRLIACIISWMEMKFPPTLNPPALLPAADCLTEEALI